MATNCLIIFHSEDSEGLHDFITGVWKHWDGYPDYVLPILQKVILFSQLNTETQVKRTVKNLRVALQAGYGFSKNDWERETQLIEDLSSYHDWLYTVDIDTKDIHIYRQDSMKPDGYRLMTSLYPAYSGITHAGDDWEDFYYDGKKLHPELG